MRIRKGLYKGREIKVPKNIRPTSDLIKKALFDILGNIEGLSFLELFAGSGAVGLEAISLGAKQVYFIDNDKECIAKIKENLQSLGIRENFVLIKSDVFTAIRKLFQHKKIFDLIFSDPPYEKGLAKNTLKTLTNYDIMNSSGLVIIQHSRREELPLKTERLILFKQRRYSETLISFYKKNVSESNLSRNI